MNCETYLEQLRAGLKMRRFILDRLEDISGVSGEGVICEGVEYSDGRVAMRWISALSSVAIYNSIEDVLSIHSHDGRTVLVWID